MQNRDIIAIGGSLGAIDASKSLLRKLPADLPAAIVMVIHVGKQGCNHLADILGGACDLRVSTAAEGETLERGHVYVAPVDHHLLVVENVIRLGRGPRENLARPAIDPLFRSVAISYGPRAVGIILTGLLSDGAAGLAALARCGGLTAIQSPGDARAPEMPLEALEATDVDYRGSSAELADVLLSVVAEDILPEFKAPADLELEVRIALGRNSNSRLMLNIADPVPLSCPSCGGVLSEIRAGPPLRFRCQVGHGFTAKVLAEAQETSVDEAIRTALRIVGERVVLLDKMAAEAERAGRSSIAGEYRQRSAELQTQVATLRKAAF